MIINHDLLFVAQELVMVMVMMKVMAMLDVALSVAFKYGTAAFSPASGPKDGSPV